MAPTSKACHDIRSVSIAIVGLGPAGLTALKCLREEVFAAVAFERREHIGGLWSTTSNSEYTSVAEQTIANISKFVVGCASNRRLYGILVSISLFQSGFSDLPISEEYPTFMTQSQLLSYFQAYTKHFALEQYCRFKATVRKVFRNASDTRWSLEVDGPDGRDIQHFDKVVFGYGSNTVPKWPQMPGKEKFSGIIMHGQNFQASTLAKQRVLVVGIGNTACEVSLSLTRKDNKVYQAYRHGRLLVSRYLDNGIPTDSTISWSILRLKYLLDHITPWLTAPLVDTFMVRKMVSDVARHDPQEGQHSAKERLRRAEQMVQTWRLLPASSITHTNPAVQEDFIPALYSGSVTPVHGFKEFVGEHRVLLQDGSVIDVDAVVFCTGYLHDFTIMPGLEMDGCCGLPVKTSAATHDLESDNGDQQQPYLPRLYQMIFPPRHADSIAFLNWMVPQEGVWSVLELASMAIAQIWAANTTRLYGGNDHIPGQYRRLAMLPSIRETEQEVDAYHAWWRKIWNRDRSVHSGFLRSHIFYRFLHDMAGTGMYENLDHLFTGRGWSLWWIDPELYKWLSGPMTGYAWRLFDTNPKQIPGCGRKAWPGARKALKDAWEEYESYKKQMNDTDRREGVIHGR